MKNMYVGIDLGIKGPHRATVFDSQENRFLDKSFGFDISFEGFESLLARVQKDVTAEEECRLNFIMEPTGLAWMPMSCYLVSRGHSAYRVSTQKSSDFRKFMNKHSKTDRIDTRTLAKLPVVAPEEVYEVYLPSTELGTLSRQTKHMAKITQQAASRKARIESLFDMINPGVLDAFGKEKFSRPARTLYRHFANPLKVVGLGKEAFFKRFRELCPTAVGERILETIYQVSLSTTKIYELMIQNGTLPFDFDQVQEEIGIELDLLASEKEKIDEIQAKIKVLYDRLDPEGYLMTPQGIGKTIAPAILGIIGDVSRFPNIDSFRAYFGFIPKKKQSVNRDKKGLGITKAAQKLLKKYLYLAAETARQYDPEFAAFYDRLTRRGLHHFQAVCALANKMAGRVYAILNRMQRAENTCYKSSRAPVDHEQQLKPEQIVYKIRDLNGKVIDKREARKIIQEKFPSKSQRKRDDLEKRKKERSQKKQKSRTLPRQIKRESTASQKSLSDQPRQFPRLDRDNSSMRSGETLPISTVLKDTFPELFLQDKIDSYSKVLGEFRAIQKEGKKIVGAVDKLYKGGAKKLEKKA